MSKLVITILLFVVGTPWVAFSQAAVKGDKKYDWYVKEYPFLEGLQLIYSMDTEFPLPEGYKKIDPSSLNSFQRWVTELPLSQKNKPVYTYGKGVKLKVGQFSRRIQYRWRTVYFTNAVLPLQLLAEFLHDHRQDHRVEFKPKKGEVLTYMNWLNKEVLFDRMGNLTYGKVQKKEASEEEFGRFCEILATNTTYGSLKENCEELAEDKLAPGDLFIALDSTGREGDVYVILDILVNDRNEKLYLVGTGCPEACDFYIPLFNDNPDNPWITLDQLKALAGEYTDVGFYRMKYR